ncbi:MAG TPA: type II toxin-antitoxin system PemK/MazF family toxin [Candidatus Obscuribacterales bacterium]
MRQREVWWAMLPAPAGRRPVLLLSRNEAYRVRTSVTVAIITSTIRNIPVEVRLGPADGLPKECVVNLDTILTIPKAALQSHLCMLTPLKWNAVVTALKFAFDIM